MDRGIRECIIESNSSRIAESITSPSEYESSSKSFQRACPPASFPNILSRNLIVIAAKILLSFSSLIMRTFAHLAISSRDESTSKELGIERDLRQLYIPENYRSGCYKLAFQIMYFKS